MLRLRWLGLLCCALWAYGCGGDVRDASAAIAAAPGQIDFGGVFVGSQEEVEVTFTNPGAARVSFQLLEAPASFSVAPTRLDIAGGSKATVRFRFAPTAAGPAAGTFLLGFSGAANPRVELPVEGIGWSRGVTAETLDFGLVALGQEETRPLVLTSLSEGELAVDLVITGTNAAAFSLATSQVIVPAGGSAPVPVTFRPSVALPHTANVLLRACPTCEPVTVGLRGEGGDAALRTVPVELDFGRVSFGGTRSLPLRLVNPGNLPLVVERAALVLEGQETWFGVALDTFPLELEPRGSHELSVQFSPPPSATRDPREALLRFTLADGEEVEVPLVGRAGGPHLVVNPERIDFGVRPLAVHATAELSVRNVGDPDEVRVLGWSFEGNDGVFAASAARSLPADVGSHPVELRIAFRPEAEGAHASRLLIHTDDDEEPILFVDLHGRARDLPPCDLAIRPGAIRFGLVTVGGAYTESVDLVNEGDSECMVWDFRFDAGSSPFFSSAGFPTDSAILPGNGGTLPLPVRFIPTGNVGRLESATISFAHSGPDAGRISIPVTGWPSHLHLVVSPNPVRFGNTPHDGRWFQNFAVTNMGAVAATLSDVRTADGSSPDFSVYNPPLAPVPLAPQGQATFQVAYEPDVPGPDTGQLEIWVAGVPEPMLVGVDALATDHECGERCAAPTAHCPAPQTTPVNNRVTLAGSASDPAGDPTTCTWRVLQAPPGARSAPDEASQCVTTFTPDIVGTYVLELTATDWPVGNTDRCTTSVQANPHGGLWVEMYWSPNGDIDLHLLHPDAGSPAEWGSWSRSPGACFFANCRGGRLAWDLPGPEDDPSLDRDDTRFGGPENIRINQPSSAHVYSAGFKNWNNPNFPVQVTYNVYCGGHQVHGQLYQSSRVQEVIWVGDVQFGQNQTCTFRHENRVLPSP